MSGSTTCPCPRGAKPARSAATTPARCGSGKKYKKCCGA
ncbi:MAG: SEC-C metal-binding domain-containing protein [Polaromonas sp.]